jgi:heme-degrading monooxygenase HmoA
MSQSDSKPKFMRKMIAKTPEPPYYAVIFTSTLASNTEEYQKVSVELEELAQTHPGFLGYESAREKIGLFISYWKDEASIKSWKQEIRHQFAQEKGKEEWYESFQVRVAKVERTYGFER